MSTLHTIPITNDKMTVHLLPSGAIHKINYDKKMINQLYGTNIDEQASNIYLRVHEDNEYDTYDLLGSYEEYDITYLKTRIQYKKRINDLDIILQLHVLPKMWFYTVKIINNSDKDITFDVFYVQDIGIKSEGAIRNNEAYNSQYIDHKVYPVRKGYAICSLQNQGNKEYLQLGSFKPLKGFATDGYQFYGLNYKTTNYPEALLQEKLPNTVYQFEFACGSLQTEDITIQSKNDTIVSFYGYYEPFHKEVISGLEYQEEIDKAYQSLDLTPIDNGITLQFKMHQSLRNTFASPPLSNEEIDELYSSRIQEEYIDNKLVSFFLEDGRHIVLQEKEQYVERSHGHIILNGDNTLVDENVFASTNYIYGLFQTQVVLGNTSFNRFISNARNGLNVQKISGQRIMIELDGIYHLLTMPAVYELGFNFSKWVYKVKDDFITITSYMGYENNNLRLTISSEQGITYKYAILNQIVMGSEEFTHPFQMKQEKNTFVFTLDETAMAHSKYPNLTYKVVVDAKACKHTDESFFMTPKKYEAQTIFLVEGNDLTLTTIAYMDKSQDVLSIQKFDDEYKRFVAYYEQNLNNLTLEIDNDSEQFKNIQKTNLIMRWYTHDAFIHYSSPHGLEQYGGAAWGTRDVCQGPFEYFLATKQFDVLRQMLLRIYTHQHLETGSWPQWFMFDKYSNIQASEAHGDIIVWPMRSLALYLNSSNDFDILDEKISYTTKEDMSYTSSSETVFEHLLKEVKYIENHLLDNTYLSQYGDGDWDDTLQPANPSLRKHMVSGWTTVLTYEAMMLLADALKNYDKEFSTYLVDFAENIKTDYNKYIIKDGVPAGFIYVDENETRYIIHPLDDTTNMTYRLLPLNRGIISEMFTKKQAEKSYSIIQNHLKHPDGVRLMNQTVPYHGGEKTYFQRAETSACFGREIGLQYVHAHIRYIEAMAKLGKPLDAWNGLLEINPITITEFVTNAMPRQANAYFSSSDANFLTRYDAMKHFDDLYSGDVLVKGGWRVYSSGPGIYLNQLIGNVLGIRLVNDSLVLDPQLPKTLDGLSVKYQFQGKPITVTYHIASNKIGIVSCTVNGNDVEYQTIPNQYRTGGIMLKGIWNKDSIHIDLFIE